MLKQTAAGHRALAQNTCHEASSSSVLQWQGTTATSTTAAAATQAADGRQQQPTAPPCTNGVATCSICSRLVLPHGMDSRCGFKPENQGCMPLTVDLIPKLQVPRLCTLGPPSLPRGMPPSAKNDVGRKTHDQRFSEWPEACE